MVKSLIKKILKEVQLQDGIEAKKFKLKKQIEALPNDMIYATHVTQDDTAKKIYDTQFKFNLGTALQGTIGLTNKQGLLNLMNDLLDGKSPHRNQFGVFILAFPKSEFGELSAERKVNLDTIESDMMDNYDEFLQGKIPTKFNFGYFKDGELFTKNVGLSSLTENDFDWVDDVPDYREYEPCEIIPLVDKGDVVYITGIVKYFDDDDNPIDVNFNNDRGVVRKKVHEFWSDGGLVNSFLSVKMDKPFFGDNESTDLVDFWCDGESLEMDPDANKYVKIRLEKPLDEDLKYWGVKSNKMGPIEEGGSFTNAAFHGYDMAPQEMRTDTCSSVWENPDDDTGCPQFSNDGKISNEDLTKAIEYLNNEPIENLIAYSRGGAILLQALQKNSKKPKRVFLVAPAWKRRWPSSNLSGSEVSGVNGVIIHGDTDSAVPLKHSVILAKQSGLPLYVIPGANHISVLKNKMNPKAGILIKDLDSAEKFLPDWGETGKGSGEQVKQQQKFISSLNESINESDDFGDDDDEVTSLKGHKGYKGWVFIHRNLNRPPYYSIKAGKSGGPVIGYDTDIYLKDVIFKVQKGGQKRVRKEMRKNVHAGVVGKIVDSGGDYDTTGWKLITYNPYQHDSFVEYETGKPIYNAKEVVMKNEKEVWVR